MEKQRQKSSVKLKMVQTHKIELPKKASSVYIPVEEVALLFRCGKCEGTPIKPPVYMCCSGHLTCSGCHDTCGRDCNQCKEPLLGRNYLLEEVVRGLPIQTCTALSDLRPETRISRSEQSLQITLQDPSHLEKLERARLEAEKQAQMTRTDSCSSLASIYCRASHRPVMCPYPCGRIVTCSALLPHFEFHHSAVPITNLPKEAKHLISVYCKDILQAEYRCLVLFIVHLDDQLHDVKWSDADLLKITKSSKEMLRNGCFVSALSVGRLINPLDNSWFLAVWCTCLYTFSPVTYTLRASTDSSSHSLSFSGPLASLHDAQGPEDVYSRGECLLLHPAMLREMNFATNALQLSITFHADLPFDFKLPEYFNIPVEDRHILGS